MKNDQTPKFKLEWIIPILVFILVIILGFIFRKTLENTFGVFFQYVLWVGDIFIKNLDQRFIWLQIIILSLALAGWYSGGFLTPTRKKRKTSLDEGASAKGRIDYWLYRIYMYRSVRSGGIYFLLDFPNLILESLAFNYRIDPHTIKDKIIAGEIQVPEEVYRIVVADESAQKDDEEDSLLGGWRNLFKRNSKQSRISAIESDARLAEVAAYLEKILEDENDG